MKIALERLRTAHNRLGLCDDSNNSSNNNSKNSGNNSISKKALAAAVKVALADGKFGSRNSGSNNNKSNSRNDDQSGVCFNFQKDGTCRFGDKCLYKHSSSSSKSHATRSTSKPTTPVNVLVCDWMLKEGKCLKGNECKRAFCHVASKSLYEQAKNKEDFLKRKKPNTGKGSTSKRVSFESDNDSDSFA